MKVKVTRKSAGEYKATVNGKEHTVSKNEGYGKTVWILTCEGESYNTTNTLSEAKELLQRQADEA